MTSESDQKSVHVVAQRHEACLVLFALAWCGNQWGLLMLAAMFVFACVCAEFFCEATEDCRRHASGGVVLGVTIMPILFSAGASSVPALDVAFRLTWWAGLAALAMKLWGWSLRRWPTLSPSLVVVSILLYMILLYTFGDVWLIPALLVSGVCLASVQKALPQSFTFGEAVLIANLCAVLFHVMLYSVILDMYPLLTLTSDLRKVIGIGLFSAVGISTLNLLLARVLLSASVQTWFDHRSACHAALTGLLVAFMLEWMSFSIGQNSLVWVWNYITEHTATPLKFIVYYMVVLVPALLFAPDGKKTKMKQVLVRKYFHVLALAMFVPTILMNIRFMALAFAVALSVFMVIESLRISEMPVVVSIVDPFMKSYIDHRDEGAAILTHIYLLLGCALPVFFNYFVLRGIFTARGLLIALSGVTVTGLGDAAASFCGITFGQHRWYGSKKTMEGTAAMIIAILVFQVLCLIVVGFHNLSPESWCKLAIADVLVALLEARTDQIDNLFLPLYHVALLQMV